MHKLTLTAKKLYRIISVTLQATSKVIKFNSSDKPLKGMISRPLAVTCAGAATSMPHTSHTRDETCKTEDTHALNISLLEFECFGCLCATMHVAISVTRSKRDELVT